MLLAVYEPGEGVALVVAWQYHLVDAVPLWLAVVARRSAQLHLHGIVVNIPVASPQACVAMLEQMPMQGHHAQAQVTIAGYYEFRVCHRRLLGLSKQTNDAFSR